MSLHVTDATLYDFPFSSASFRLRIALNLKKLSPKAIEHVNLRTGDQFKGAFVHMASAPMVPILDFGSEAYGQSLALIEWLDVTYPSSRLIPQDPDEALAVRSLAMAIACDIHPLNTPRVLNRLTGEMGQTDEARQDWYNHWVREGFTALDRMLDRREASGRYCFGTVPTLADICLVPQVFNARRFGVPIDEFDRILSIFDHCMAHDAFRNAAPQTE